MLRHNENIKGNVEKKYIPALHAFRAFAVINIVALHAIEIIFYFSSLAENKADLTSFSWIVGVLFHDSTLYFTFISGILFSLVLAKRGYVQFFKSKLLNVLLPYLLITCFMTWRIARTDAPVYFDGSLWEFINVWSHKLITGSAVFSFWYMPVLFVLYLATPLFAKLLTVKKAKWLVIVVILMPLIFSRSWPGIPWVNFVYFIGAYLLGMLVGKNYQKTVEFIRHYLLSFTDLRVPDSDRLGDVGSGWKVAIVTLMNERLAVGGSPGPDWGEIMTYAKEQGTMNDAAFRAKLADWYVAAQGYKLTKFRTQTALSKGQTPGPESSIGKIITANHLQDICNSAIEMQDHYGIMSDTDTMPQDALFQQSFMWAPGLRIAGGTDEILKNIIAERVLGLPQDTRVDKNVPFDELKQG